MIKHSKCILDWIYCVLIKGSLIKCSLQLIGFLLFQLSFYKKKSIIHNKTSNLLTDRTFLELHFNLFLSIPTIKRSNCTRLVFICQLSVKRNKSNMVFANSKMAFRLFLNSNAKQSNLIYKTDHQ